MREKTYDSIQKLKRVRKSTETQIKQLHYCSKNHCKLDRHFPVYETHSDGNSVSVFMLQFYTLSKGYVMCILNVASTVKESPFIICDHKRCFILLLIGLLTGQVIAWKYKTPLIEIEVTTSSARNACELRMSHTSEAR